MSARTGDSRCTVRGTHHFGVRTFPLLLLLPALCAVAWSAARAAEVVPPPGAPLFNHARFFPAPGREKAMVGGKFSGSIVSENAGFQMLGEIKTAPRAGEWTDLVFSNARLYRWLRYDAPEGSHGSLAELEFYAGTRRLDGLRFGSVGEREGRGWRLAYDGDPKTWVEMTEPAGHFTGIDLREQATARTPRFSPPPFGVQKPLRVLLTGLTPYATIRYTLDGTMPTADTGLVFEAPFPLAATTTVVAASFVEGWAPSPPLMGTYLIGDVPAGLRTLHLGNTLTDATERFADYARTAGRPHVSQHFTIPNATTQRLWDSGLTQRKRDWTVALGVLEKIDHVTLQPRDFKIEQEADYARRFLDLLRAHSPAVQPWLYTEWVERERARPSDKGAVPSSQMARVFPALTWEESMGAMLLYVEEVQREIARTDHGAKRVRVLPIALAMGWLRHRIERGEFPDAGRAAFHPLLFRDSVHPNPNGAFLIHLLWYAAFYRESPEGRVRPIGTTLTAAQALAMQRLAWDVIENYPDCGIFAEGPAPVARPAFAPGAAALAEDTPVRLSSETPRAWFRYTLDGTTPTRTNGYVYCGTISVRPGMKVKAIAYKNGGTDSAVTEAVYPLLREPTAPAKTTPPSIAR